MSTLRVKTIFEATDRVSKTLTKMQTSVMLASQKMSKGFQAVSKQINSAAQASRSLAVTAGASAIAVGAPMAAMIRMGANFEQKVVNAFARFAEVEVGSDKYKELVRVARQAGVEVAEGAKPYQILEDSILKFGATTEFTGKQVAEAAEFMSIAGWQMHEAIAAMPQVVDLATASNTDLGTAADIATDTLGAFNLTVKDTSRVVDVLAKSTTTSNMTMETLKEAIKQGGQPFTQIGGTIEQFTGLVGLMSNAFIKGSKAGTAMKNLALQLAAPSSEGRRVLKELGIEVEDKVTGKFRKVTNILGDLNDELLGATQRQRAKAIKLLFGKVPIAGIMTLLSKTKAGMEGQIKVVSDNEKAAEGMANTMRNTVSGSFAFLRSAIDAVVISVFNMNKGPLKDTVDNMTKWINANSELISSKIGGWMAFIIDNLGIITMWLGRVIATAIGMSILSSIVNTISNLTKVWTGIQWALNAAMTANPIGAIVVGIGALIAAIYLLYTNFDIVTGAVSAGWDFMLKGAWRFFDWMTGGKAEEVAEAWAPLGRAIAKVWEVAMSALSPFFNMLSTMIDYIFDSIGKLMSLIPDMLSKIGEFLDPIRGMIGDALIYTGEGLSSIAGLDNTAPALAGGSGADITGNITISPAPTLSANVATQPRNGVRLTVGRSR